MFNFKTTLIILLLSRGNKLENKFILCLTGTVWRPLAEFSLADVSCVMVWFGLELHWLGKPNLPTAGFGNNEHMLLTSSRQKPDHWQSVIIFPAFGFFKHTFWCTRRHSVWRQVESEVCSVWPVQSKWQSSYRLDINEMLHHFILKLWRQRLESWGCGQLWPHCGWIWLSHTPARFGLAVKTIETLVTSQKLKRLCLCATGILGHDKVLPPLSASKVKSNFLWHINK